MTARLSISSSITKHLAFVTRRCVVAGALAAALSTAVHAAWIDVRVDQSSDDAYERAGTGAMSTSATSLRLLSNSSGTFVFHSGIRFTDIPIGSGIPVTGTLTTDGAGGPEIEQSFVEVMSANGSAAVTEATIDMEDNAVDAVNPPTFTSSAGDLTSRTGSTNAVVWDVPAAASGTRYRTTDLTDLIEETIFTNAGLGSWDAGAGSNAMVFRFVTTVTGALALRLWFSEDAGADRAPILRMEVSGARPLPTDSNGVTLASNGACFGVSDVSDQLISITGLGGAPLEGTFGGGQLATNGSTFGTSVEAITYDPVEGDLYGSDFGALGRINQQTGEFIQLTSTYGTADDLSGGGSVVLDHVDSLAFHPDGRLLAVHQTDADSGSPAATAHLFVVDKLTGAHVDKGVDGVLDAVTLTLPRAGNDQEIEDIAIDPTDGTLYVLAESHGNRRGWLYTYDSATGTLINELRVCSGGTCGGGGGSRLRETEGLSFSPDGTLYLSTGLNGGPNSDRLFTLDKTTGVATLVHSFTASDIEGLACGFADLTEASVAEFHAYAHQGHALVEWRTEWEHGTLGFDLLRRSGGETEFTKVNDALLPGLLHARNGGVYRFEDESALPGQSYEYLLVEQEAAGGKRSYGPYAVVVAGTAPPLPAGATDRPASRLERMLRAAPPGEKDRTERRKASRKEAKRQQAKRRSARAKVLVSQDGIYRLDASEIASALGATTAEVRDAIGQNGLSLRNQRQRVAVMPDNDNGGLLFYGQGIDSLYTDQNVYWLSFGRATPMARARARDVRPSKPGSIGSFPEVSVSEADLIPLTHLFDDPDDDYWMWDYRIGGVTLPDCSLEPTPPACNYNSLAVDSLGRKAGSTATLTVELHGGTDTAHSAAVQLAGTTLGTIGWQGIVPVTQQFTVDAALLADGSNEVSITGAPSGQSVPSVFYINHLTLDYDREHVAHEGQLLGETGAQRNVTVGGFSDDDVIVWLTTRPNRPKIPAGLSVTAQGTGFQVSFKASRKHSRPFAAVARSAIQSPDAIIPDLPSGLRAKRNAADYLIITSSALLSEAERLAAYRSAQGFTTKVVDIEDVYDEFAFGLSDPNAIWRFLHHAHLKWKSGGPRYVLFAGDGSYDYKDALGNGDSVVPALLTPTPDGLVPSDNLYVDVVGNDYRPEMAVGRLPAVDASELRTMIDKIIAFEAASGAWTRKATVVADPPDNGGPFPADSDAIAGLMDDYLSVDRVYRAEPIDALGECASHRDCLLDAIDEGRAFLNFVGHGNFVNLGKGGFITPADVAGMNNGDRLPIVTAQTCLVGNFGLPGAEVVGESLIRKPEGGAVAVWASSSLSINARARTLGQGFYAATFPRQAGAAGELLIGEAVMKAQARYAEDGFDAYLLDTYNLLGDPATRMK